jgi:DNA-binding transcriptional regulator YiaG
VEVVEVLAMEGKELKKLRIDLEVDQKELAERLGVSVGTVSRWENNQTRMTPAHEKLLSYIVKEIKKEKGLR